MRSDSLRPLWWAAGVALPDACGELCYELGVQFDAPFPLAVAAPGPHLGIVQALGFSAIQRLFFDQQTLALVPLPRAAPFQHDGGKRRVVSRPACECRIARRQERKVVQVRACEAERATIARKNDHGVPVEIVAALVAVRVPVANENSPITGAIDGGALGGHGLILGPDR
jgi:hypothetical protein